MKPTLYLMMGYPGSGKTTIAEIIAGLTGAVHLASDKIRLEMFPEPTFNEQEHAALYKEIDRRTARLLSERKSVIYDANLNRQIHRQEKYHICEKTNSAPILVWVKTPREVAKERATRDDRAHLIPSSESAEGMFERISGVIEEPGSNERPVIIEGINVTESVVRQKLQLS